MKIRPPRLNGDRISVYATRSPHRINKIGLSCVKIDKIEKATIFLSQVDLLDETPVIDIKPYIPRYDSVPEAMIPQWIETPAKIHDVEFTDQSLLELHQSLKHLEFYTTFEEIKQAIVEVLQSDPRGRTLKQKNNPFYAFYIDNLNVVIDVNDGKCIVQQIEVIKDWDPILKVQYDHILEAQKQ